MKKLIAYLFILVTPLMASVSSPFVSVAKNATPAVVFIQVENAPPQQVYGQDPNDMFNDEFFRRFFGGPPPGQGQTPQASQGSGFLVSEDGYIMTNYHVVKDAKTIKILMQNGTEREMSATLVGGDPQTDVAVLKLDDTDGQVFPYLNFGDSDDLQVGEWVVAIGTPFGLEASVTHGIVSAKGRQGLQITDLEDFIQTDASINPGNSGGPLLNLEGEVIGINTAILSRSGGYMGIGFAIPSHMAENIKTQIISTGAIKRGFLGVSLQPIDKDLSEAFGFDNTDGALVSDIVEGSPAAAAGLVQGDIIIEFNGKRVKSPASLRKEIMLLEPGTTIKLTINREGKTQKISITLGDQRESGKEPSEIAKKLGFSIENISSEMVSRYRLNPDEQGVIVSEVMQGSPSAKSRP